MLAWLFGGETEPAQPEVVVEDCLETSAAESEKADEKETKKAALVEAELKLQVVEAKLKSDPLTDEKRLRLELKRERLLRKLRSGHATLSPLLAAAAGESNDPVDESDWSTLLERKPFPECLAVGDHVSVRDASDDVWEEGVVESIDSSMGPRVRKLTYDGAYYWDFIRPLGSTAELKRWSDYEKLRKRKLRAALREAALGTQEQRAAWREASGDYSAADNALRVALDWEPLQETSASSEGGCSDVASLLAAWPKATGLLDAAQRETLAAIKSPQHDDDIDGNEAAYLESLVRSSFAVYEVDGDMDDLSDSLQRVASFCTSSQGSIGAGSDDLGDLDFSEGSDDNDDDDEIDKIFGVDELLSSKLDLSKSTSRDRSGSSDSGDLTQNSDVDGEDSNLSEEDDSDDDDNKSAKDEESSFSEDEDENSVEEEDDDDDDASQASSASSPDYDVNALPSALVFHEVVSLVKKHLNLSKSLSPTECANRAEDALGLDYPPGSTLRQKLNLALLQLRGD